MIPVLKRKVTVKAGGVVSLRSNGLKPGTKAELIGVTVLSFRASFAKKLKNEIDNHDFA